MLQLILRHPAVAPATGEALTPRTVKIVKIDFQDVYRISANSSALKIVSIAFTTLQMFCM